ncbi:MAG: DNA repair protein RadC [Clostridia bacterium]|nr:DNA repair protein RadC [Clostridia bacterium]
MVKAKKQTDALPPPGGEDNQRREKAAFTHSGHRQRLKDAALATNLVGMSSYQVLELLLYYAMPYRDTNELAHALIDHFGSLAAVMDANYQSLLEVKGIGPHAATLLTLLPALFRRYQQDLAAEKAVLLNREQTIAYIRNLFIGKSYEEFYMICLSGQYRVLQPVMLNQGSLSEVTVYPRIAVEVALRHKAKYVILAHNHPGGSIQPSADDVRLTEKITGVLAELSIRVLDHLVISGEFYFSFSEKGLLPRY